MENSDPGSYDFEILDSLVRRVFKIEDVTLGTRQQKYLVRYRGQLWNEDSAAAYDQLAALLRPYGLTPLFRLEEGRQVILLMQGVLNPKPANPWINLVLFIVTLLSVLATGALYGLDQPLPSGFFPIALELFKRGWPFALSMIAILAAHEFGHYLAGRFHGVHVTLPYFIPLPLSPFGTMGAFINMKEPPKNRRHLLDIGIAGPLSGLIVAVPVLLLGLSLSTIDRLPSAIQPGISLSLEGNSLLYLLSKYLVFGQLLPAPVSYEGLSPFVYWLRYFFTGQPLPLGGSDVLLHPVAWAGWAGILITGLNLIPAGQLDGGHMLYVLFGRKTATRIFPFVLAGLVMLGLGWSGWWLWVVLIYFIGRAYAEPLDQITQLDPPRRLLAVLALILFLLTFTPVPLNLIM